MERATSGLSDLDGFRALPTALPRFGALPAAAALPLIVAGPAASLRDVAVGAGLGRPPDPATAAALATVGDSPV